MKRLRRILCSFLNHPAHRRVVGIDPAGDEGGMTARVVMATCRCGHMRYMEEVSWR